MFMNLTIFGKLNIVFQNETKIMKIVKSFSSSLSIALSRVVIAHRGPSEIVANRTPRVVHKVPRVF